MRMRTVGLILVTFAVGAGVGIWTEGRRGTAAAQSRRRPTASRPCPARSAART